MKTNQLDAWKARHNQALRNPMGFEAPIVNMVNSLEMYASSHLERYESKIGADYVLGPAWLSLATGLRTLLNGDCGRLDCGTLDGQIIDLIANAGFDIDSL